MAENVKHDTGDSIPFFPDHVRTEAWVVAGITALALIVGAVAMAIPVGVGDPADPLNTPLHVKPEWYFLALYQLLKFVPETVGVMIPILGILLVIVWPFLDRSPDTKRARLIRAIGVAVFVVVFIVMTIWGELS
jgi:quinol-cytochrome oxidoreductase complex cytochrome b subunit